MELKVSKLSREISTSILNSTQDKINIAEYCKIRLRSDFSDLSDFEIEDILDELIEKIKFHINKRNEYCKKQGIAPEYEFNDYPPNVLLRYSLKHKESDTVLFLRKNRIKLLSTINKLSWKSFENFCIRLLNINGVNTVELTKSNKEGVDFCGVYDIGKYFSSPVIPKYFEMRLVGQVKHYSTNIGPGLVRAFKTYCDEVKNKEENVMKDLPRWFIESEAPVLGIFMTISDFTKGAIRYGKKEWIMLRNGEQLIDDLIRSPQSETWIKNENGKQIFDEASFIAFFKKQN